MPQTTGNTYTTTPSTLTAMVESGKMHRDCLGVWTMGSQGGESHVAVQGVIQKKLSMDRLTVKKYIDQLVEYGFFIPTKDSRFPRSKVFDLDSSPNLQGILSRDALLALDVYEVYLNSPKFANDWGDPRTFSDFRNGLRKKSLEERRLYLKVVSGREFQEKALTQLLEELSS